MYIFVQQTINGIALGSIYALTAIGYSLVYGVLELVNFAHGTIYMIGAFLFYIFAVLCGMNWGLAFVLSVVATGVIGILYERIALRPLRLKNLPKFFSLICTIGVSIFLQNVVFLFMGSETRLYPTLFEGQYVNILGANVSFIQILIVVCSIILMLALTFFIQKSKMGMAMRATAQNREASELMGISVDNVVSLTFFLGSALAAVAGIFASMSFRSVDISIGVSTGIKTFAATVLGGIGELAGAVLGGLIIGLAEIFTAGYIGSDLRDMAAFIVLIIVLIFRPNGLLGKAVQKKV